MRRLLRPKPDLRRGVEPAQRRSQIQKRAPRSEADLAVEFVRLDDLSDTEREANETLERTGRIIVRDKEVPIPADDGIWLSPAQVSKEVSERLGWRFAPSSEFPKA